jgi:lipoyl(octanoyl) transferase
MEETPEVAASTQLLDVRRLGLVEYEDGLLIQNLLQESRRRNILPDTLLFLEHPPVITLGRSFGRDVTKQILCPMNLLQERDIDIVVTDRGGGATYHGPGQLVVYPVIELRGPERDVHRYLRLLEEATIRTLADFGIAAHREPGKTGVWVHGEKIASIGVHLSRWITRHGLALNVSNDLGPFDLIIPCGLTGVRMTSMERVCARHFSLPDVEDAFRAHFATVFGRTPRLVPVEHESVLVILRATSTGRYLLLRRRVEAGGFWQPVTGFIERGETPSEAARREVYEETGLLGSGLVKLPYTHCFAIDPMLWPQASDAPLIIVQEHTFALGLSDETLPIRLDPQEHTDFRFLSLDEALEQVRWRGTRRALKLAERAQPNVSIPYDPSD